MKFKETIKWIPGITEAQISLEFLKLFSNVESLFATCGENQKYSPQKEAPLTHR